MGAAQWASRGPVRPRPRDGGNAAAGHREAGGSLPRASTRQGLMAGTDKSAPGARPRARDLNEQIRYTMWSVFRVADRAALEVGASGRDGLAAELEGFIDQAAGKDVITRGCYDVQGLRADADYMIWWTAPAPDDLQEVYARFRRTGLGRASEPVWSVLALHRPAEFNKGHIPAFLAGEEAKAYACVYPFVRSYEWYLLPDDERRMLLAEHGQKARTFPDVRANTVASFALGDYEWILAFEADELHRIVDLMRELRTSETRRHVREEVPFFTGRRRTITELVAGLA